MSNTERPEERPEKTRSPKRSASGDRHSVRPKVLARLPDLDLKELDRVVESPIAKTIDTTVRRKWQQRIAAGVLVSGAAVLLVAVFFPSRSQELSGAPGDAAVYQPDAAIAKINKKQDAKPNDLSKSQPAIAKVADAKPIAPIMVPALPAPAMTREIAPRSGSSTLPTATISMPAVSSGTQLIPMPSLSENGLPLPPVEPGPASGNAQVVAAEPPVVAPVAPAPAPIASIPFTPASVPTAVAPVQTPPQVISSPFTAEYEAVRRENLAMGPFVQPPLTTSPLVNPVATPPAVAQPTNVQPTQLQPAVPVMAVAPAVQPAMPVQPPMAPAGYQAGGPPLGYQQPTYPAAALPVAPAVPTAPAIQAQTPIYAPAAGQPQTVQQPLPTQPYPPAASNGYPSTGYQAALPAMQTAGPGGLPMVAPNGIRLDGINNNPRSAQRSNYGDARSSIR